MSDPHINERLDDFIDGALDEAQARMLAQHLAACESCRKAVESAERLRQRLREHTVPVPDAEFFDRALARATHVGTSRQRNRWIMTGFGGALAAGLVAWIIGGAIIHAPSDPAGAIPGVTMALEQPRTVNLVFSSATDLNDAVLTVSLPHGIEIEGYAGLRQITWMTSLKAGKNILPLKLIATTPHGGELLATLEHDNRDRTFRLRVTVS